MEDVRANLRVHINMKANEDWKFNSDTEYAYAVGQAAAYLLSLSKGNNKTSLRGNIFFNARNAEIIRKKLAQQYNKYDYTIPQSPEVRINKLIAHLMTYEPEAIDNEMILAGFVAASLMYEKKDKESGEEK